MKVFTLILTILLSLTISAQSSKIPIDGFGNFKFGMTKKEVQNAIKTHKTPETKVQSMKKSLQIQNIELDGTIYDNCILDVEEPLSMGIFTNHFSARKVAEMQFNQLLKTLEQKYGEVTVSDWNALWYDKENKAIMLMIEEKNDKIVLLLTYMSGLSF